MGGLVGTLGMALPLRGLGLGVLAGGGFLSVFMYMRRQVNTSITPGVGAKVGAASGGIGFGIFAILTVLGMLLSDLGSVLRDQALAAIDQTVARSPGALTQEMVQRMKSPEGVAVLIAIGLVVTLIIFLVGSSLGGAIAAKALGRSKRP